MLQTHACITEHGIIGRTNNIVLFQETCGSQHTTPSYHVTSVEDKQTVITRLKDYHIKFNNTINMSSLYTTGSN